MSDEFTSIGEDPGAKAARVRHRAHPSQQEKNRENRSNLSAHVPDKSKSHVHPADSEGIDIFLSDKDGTLDPTAPAPKKHFQPISGNIDEVEKRMMEDAPKPLPEGQYKVEDIFDLSYKDLMKDDKSVVATSISDEKQKKKDEEDEFDVF
eukprot:NODE_8955_length_631_cov_63.236220_g8327_i0.p1 GENE.NODE_8955_length_631_cov_63.236220_g8327_i0~~NODE_8955_length_631_cov_63.236220_g8327_i0.p1  ORF type:complete len:150 (+),score=26.78 NODE_8955_length_631_cov_63.236220_g8327_i0:77-526(+)